MKFYIEEPSVVTLGKFDGLHLGHRHLMEELGAGRKEGLKSVVFTFDIPPQSASENDYRVLSTNEEKKHIFSKTDVDYLIECPFTETFKRQTPEEFLKMLSEHIRVKRIVAGTDFRFGYKRSGTYRDLEAYAARFGYDAVIVEKIQYRGADISSTRIREALINGELKEANRLLGYEYFVIGTVSHGNALGRTLGFPTANLVPPREKLLPPNGVYAVHAEIDGRSYCGVCNVGRKPTLEGDYPVGIETYLYDFDGDLYDRRMKVSFTDFIRPEQKFPSVEALAAQIARDREEGRRIFACACEKI